MKAPCVPAALTHCFRKRNISVAIAIIEAAARCSTTAVAAVAEEEEAGSASVVPATPGQRLAGRLLAAACIVWASGLPHTCSAGPRIAAWPPLVETACFASGRFQAGAWKRVTAKDAAVDPESCSFRRRLGQLGGFAATFAVQTDSCSQAVPR